MSMKSGSPSNSSENEACTRRGRPRAFDVDAALEAAMNVFWEHGYEGTSLDALTEAMGINRPSLYAAFGNKESLFRKAIDRYEAKASGFIDDALARPTAREVVERLLIGSIGCIESASPSKGCMLVQALTCGSDAETVRSELAARRCSVEGRLRERFVRAQLDGDLPANVEPATLAKLVVTFQHGIAVQLASNVSRADLVAAVRLALSNWPPSN